jgi:hypothetical protein
MSDYSQIAESIASTIACSGQPLTENQRISLVAGVFVWMEKEVAAERERCAKIVLHAEHAVNVNRRDALAEFIRRGGIVNLHTGKVSYRE